MAPGVAIAFPEMGGLKDIEVRRNSRLCFVAIAFPEMGGLKVYSNNGIGAVCLAVAIAFPEMGGLKEDIGHVA
jgi:hypothetical protein